MLEASGLVRSQKTGRTRTCSINPAVLRSTESWIADRRVSVERRPSRVFAAFASAEAKNVWGGTGDLGPADGEAGITEFDFGVGGRERFGIKVQGTTYRYDARYYDIVPDQRIVYAYEMYADDARISVSVATIEFTKNADGTALTWTEQGTYLDGIDGPEASSLRQGGTAEMLDGPARHLAPPAAP